MVCSTDLTLRRSCFWWLLMKVQVFYCGMWLWHHPHGLLDWLTILTWCGKSRCPYTSNLTRWDLRSSAGTHVTASILSTILFYSIYFIVNLCFIVGPCNKIPVCWSDFFFSFLDISIHPFIYLITGDYQICESNMLQTLHAKVGKLSCCQLSLLYKLYCVENLGILNQ